MLDALTQTTPHTHAMFMHHIVAYACVWFPSPFLLDRSCSGECSRVPVRGAMPPCWSTRQATPLFISIKSYSLTPALIYCIRTTMIQLLHVVIVEPLSSAWHVIATVNRWNPLAWVGVVWALMCLLIHACCHACYCLDLCQVWFIGDELEVCEHVLLLRAKCVNTIW